MDANTRLTARPLILSTSIVILPIQTKSEEIPVGVECNTWRGHNGLRDGKKVKSDQSKQTKHWKGKEGNQGSVRCYFCVPDQGIRFVGVQSSGGCYNRLLRMIPDNTFSYYYYICKLKIISYNPMSRTCRSGSID